MRTWHSAQDAAVWLRSRVTGELRTDSRLVQAGDGFIAWPGAATDGRRYLAQALAQGAQPPAMQRDDVIDDVHAPAAYRTHLALQMLAQARQSLS